ncbi:MAG: response regulator [Anaerolineae bacterium]|nr:response regulator [Anaerolineae bacterium]
MANVLVAEDSPDARQLMRDLLEGLNHNVAEANDGLEAVKIALTSHPDLIIMDLMMPAASGDSAIKFMRGMPELKDIPVLVVSAHPDVAHISKANGADDWVAKPISIRELAAKINNLINKEPQG